VAASSFAGGTGDEVTVTVSQPFTSITRLIGNLRRLVDAQNVRNSRPHQPAGRDSGDADVDIHVIDFHDDHYFDGFDEHDNYRGPRDSGDHDDNRPESRDRRQACRVAQRDVLRFGHPRDHCRVGLGFR
jgi:hypothetical protein